LRVTTIGTQHAFFDVRGAMNESENRLEGSAFAAESNPVHVVQDAESKLPGREATLLSLEDAAGKGDIPRMFSMLSLLIQQFGAQHRKSWPPAMVKRLFTSVIAAMKRASDPQVCYDLGICNAWTIHEHSL
jgi:hypothetical protein